MEARDLGKLKTWSQAVAAGGRGSRPGGRLERRRRLVGAPRRARPDVGLRPGLRAGGAAPLRGRRPRSRARPSASGSGRRRERVTDCYVPRRPAGSPLGGRRRGSARITSLTDREPKGPLLPADGRRMRRRLLSGRSPRAGPGRSRLCGQARLVGRGRDPGARAGSCGLPSRRHGHPGRARRALRLRDGRRSCGDRQAGRSALDPGPRRPARRSARADPRREGVHRGRQGCRPRAAVAVRYRGRRPAARPAQEPRREGRRARAAARRARVPRRGRVLAGPDRGLPRLRARAAPRRLGHVPAPRPDRLAATDPRDRLQARRATPTSGAARATRDRSTAGSRSPGASTARGSSGASTSSRPTRPRAHSRRPSRAERRTR